MLKNVPCPRTSPRNNSLEAGKDVGQHIVYRATYRAKKNVDTPAGVVANTLDPNTYSSFTLAGSPHEQSHEQHMRS